MSIPLTVANALAGERLVSAGDVARAKAEQMQTHVGVGALDGVWAGTDIKAAEVKGYVDDIASYTLKAAQIPHEREDLIWRTLAGAIYRALLVGALAAGGD